MKLLYRKIFAICLFLVVMSMSIGAVSAFTPLPSDGRFNGTGSGPIVSSCLSKTFDNTIGSGSGVSLYPRYIFYPKFPYYRIV